MLVDRRAAPSRRLLLSAAASVLVVCGLLLHIAVSPSSLAPEVELGGGPFTSPNRGGGAPQQPPGPAALSAARAALQRNAYELAPHARGAQGHALRRMNLAAARLHASQHASRATGDVRPTIPYYDDGASAHSRSPRGHALVRRLSRMKNVLDRIHNDPRLPPAPAPAPAAPGVPVPHYAAKLRRLIAQLRVRVDQAAAEQRRLVENVANLHLQPGPPGTSLLD